MGGKGPAASKHPKASRAEAMKSESRIFFYISPLYAVSTAHLTGCMGKKDLRVDGSS